MTKLECKEIFEVLSEYLDRELPPDLCDRIEGHIGHCPPCVEFVKSLEKTVSLCKGFEVNERAGPLPDEVMENLRARCERYLPK